MRSIFGIVFGLFIALNGLAQTAYKGIVLEAGNSDKLNKVFVQNLANKETVFTDISGKFSIRASVNDIIVFSSPGYISDTLFLVNLNFKRIYLAAQGIRLNEVEITGKAFDPRRDYPSAYTQGKWIQAPEGGGLAFSPSRLFGKKGKDARRFKRYLENEVVERQIDALFSKNLVSGIVPLKGVELQKFMHMYRPSLTFLKKASSQDMLLYINDCYKKFKELPAEEPLQN